MRDAKSGFTFIEVLAVVSIMFSLAGMATVGFQNYVSYQQFRAAAVEVGSLLREARQDTLASQNDARYGLYFATSSITRFAGEVFDSSDPNNQEVRFYGVELTPSFSGGSTELVFSRLSGVPSATGTILITSERLGATTSISVSEAGIIE